MVDWSELLASGDILATLIIVVICIITGGVGAAIVSAVGASRRGVKGDALVREQNGIEGLSKLADGQAGYITTLENRVERVELDVVELTRQLHSEIEYSNLLIRTLSEKNIPIPSRPVRR